MKRYAIAAAVGVLLGFGAAGSARAQENPPEQGKLTEFDVHDAAREVASACGGQCGTLPLVNNDWGVVTGFYTDKHVVPHGFVRFPSGQIVSFDAPGADLTYNLNRGTVAYSINDFGVIVGDLDNSSNVFYAFIRYPDGSFTTFGVPATGIGGGAGTGPGQGTAAYDINIEGDVAGIYIDGSGTQHGFVRSRSGEIATFDPPGSVYTGVCEETCLNPEGAVTGGFTTYNTDTGYASHGFVRYPDGTIKVFDAPQVISGVFTGDGGASINVEGVVTGYMVNSNSEYLGLSFVRLPDGSFISFQAPDAATGPGQGTFAFSINAFGAVTGQYTDAANNNIGFERFPDGRFLNFAAKNGGPGIFAGTRPSTNNLEGEVTGWIVDATGLNHGFVWRP